MDLQTRLADAVQRHGVAGAAVAVSHPGGRAEAAAGVLNLETREPVTPHSLFPVASVTKPWTATLVLQLVDDGLLDLDEPVVAHLPEFGVVDPDASRTVTARHLLTHTGGFLGDLFTDTGAGDDALTRYLAHLREAATQLSPPGDVFSYCNSGFSVLGALVARLRGGSWESVLRERLAGPLGADHLALSEPDAAGRAVANGHLGTQPLPSWQLPRSNGPAGSVMCAAPGDLVRLGRALCDGSVVSARSFAAMRAPQVAVPGVRGRGARRWGLGLALHDWDGGTVVGHDGDIPGCSAALWMVPDHDVTIAFTANSNSVGGLVDDVLLPLLAELTGIRVPSDPVPPDPLPAVDGAAFAGRYATPMYRYDVTADGPALTVTTTPLGLAAEMGRQPSTDRYVPLDDETWMTADPVDGHHQTIAFVDGGRFLHTGRAAPRQP